MNVHPEFPILTARLRLRPFTRGDVDAVFAYRRLEAVARYLFDGPLSREDCAEAIQQRISQVAFDVEGDKIVLAVELPASGQVIGEVSLIWRNEDARQGEVGWIFHPEHQGRGYATEAARVLFALGFGDAGLHRVMARCDARNSASARLMDRLGMRREAHFREHKVFKGGWDEEFVYALLEGEWRDSLMATKKPLTP